MDTMLVSPRPLLLTYSHTRAQSFYAGRPPNVSPDWIDAPYPDDEFPFENDIRESEMSCMYDPVFSCQPSEIDHSQGILGLGGSRDCCMKYWLLPLVQ